MNKKGFTLVELLAVIAVLGILIVITATNGLGIFNKTKNSINTIEEDNLLESARVFLVDVDNELVKSWPSGCNNIDKFINKDCVVSVNYLEDNNYFDDKSNKCNGEGKLKLKIEKDTDGNTTDYIVEKVGIDAICVN